MSCRLQLPALALSPSQQMQELCWQGKGMSLPDAMQGCESPSPRADSSLALLTALLSESFCFTAKKPQYLQPGQKYLWGLHVSHIRPPIWFASLPPNSCVSTSGEGKGGSLQQGPLKTALPERRVCESAGNGARRCLVVEPTRGRSTLCKCADNSRWGGWRGEHQRDWAGLGQCQEDRKILELSRDVGWMGPMFGLRSSWLRSWTCGEGPMDYLESIKITLSSWQQFTGKCNTGMGDQICGGISIHGGIQDSTRQSHNGLNPVQTPALFQGAGWDRDTQRFLPTNISASVWNPDARYTVLQASFTACALLPRSHWRQYPGSAHH